MNHIFVKCKYWSQTTRVSKTNNAATTAAINRCDQPCDIETNNSATTAAIERVTFKRTTISDIKSQPLVADSGR